MKAIILAGGSGTRLRPYVENIPKPMALVNGRPFLEILIGKLIHGGVTDIILSVGYKKEIIYNHFQKNDTKWKANILYSPENSPLGTGGAIREAMASYPDDRYLVLNGDSFFDNDLSQLIAYHTSKQAVVTLALANVADRNRYGCVELNSDGLISHFAEKATKGPGHINAGIYVIDHSLLASFPNSVFSFEKDTLPKLVSKCLYGICQDGFFIDIGTPSDYISIRDSFPYKLRSKPEIMNEIS